ncbi:MoaD/ThiS family protein [Granulosicoccaceae sp. 1_MG-2023]|nr:MoaD/ThiS family protein [Granulosicoccaceae sp. 1_MG-2023]
MKITLKLYATLTDLLPPGAERNQAVVEVPDDATLQSVIETYKVPPELAHLVLINGHFFCVADRAETRLKENDVVAIWPPVAGG